MNSQFDIQPFPIIETVFEAKDSITGPELINGYYQNENHILFSSLDRNLILYNYNRKTRVFSSKIELTTKTLTPILSMTYNSKEKAIIFLDACNYIYYDNLEDTSNHHCIKENIEEIESIIYLINNKYFIKTNSCINYIYEINKDNDPKSPILIIKPIMKYIFPYKPNNIRYILYSYTKNNYSIDDIDENEEEESESDEDNTDNADELLIIGNILGKIEVIQMDNMDKKYSFKCFVNNDYYIAVTVIAYDNLRQNIYIGSNDGGLYGLNITNRKKFFFNKKI